MTQSYGLWPMDCRDAMRMCMAPDSVDSLVTDPPYELGFMGKGWDASGIANDVDMWREAYRVLKPGGHLLAFSGSRTYHRMVVAIEDAGFEIRDQIMWIYGSGFPKSLDVSKAIDKAAGAVREVVGDHPWAHVRAGGAERDEGSAYGTGKTRGPLTVTAPATPEAVQWQGWGTALKPAHEPIVVARKPLAKGCTVAANVLTHGTGALNIDACRVGTSKNVPASPRTAQNRIFGAYGAQTGSESGLDPNVGRFPANVIHDGSDEVLAGFPNEAGRFYYCAKASKADRNEGCDALPEQANRINAPRQDEAAKFAAVRANHHPTVKPSDLMRYLVRLVTPPSGTVFDPFTGSGSTGKAAMLEGFSFVGCEMTPEYVPIAEARIAAALAAYRANS